MDYLQTLNTLFAANAAKIAEHERALESLKLSQQKIQAARALHAELGFSTSDASHHEEPSQEQKGLTLKQMILIELKTTSPLSRQEIFDRIRDRYAFKPNALTIGSTLSKMVASGEVEKAGHFAYQPKSEVPNGLAPVGTSSATMSEPDAI